MNRKYLPGVAFLLFLSVSLTSCGLLPKEEELPAAPIVPSYEVQEYKQTTVKRGDIAVTKSIKSEYVPAREESLGFALGGEVIAGVYVTQGQTVKAGQILAELDQRDLKTKLAAREYQVQVLQLKKEHLLEDWAVEASRLDETLVSILQELETTRALILRLSQWQLQGEKNQPAQGSTWVVEECPTTESMETLKNRETDLLAQRDARRAKVAPNEAYAKQLQTIEDSLSIEKMYLAELQKDVRDRQIIAPISGTVTYLTSVTHGQRSSEGETFLRIADMNSTAFVVTGESASLLPVGTTVAITCNKKTYEAVAVRASSLGLSASGEATAYLTLKQPDPTLESGDGGTIVLTLDSRTDVLYVPNKTVKSTDEGYFVYVLDENGFKVRQPVTVGLEADRETEILSGLAEGDSVVEEE